MRKNAGQFHFDPSKMVVGGRSAGGNLAAALCLLAKERGAFRFACQVLDHPYLDLCHIIDDSQRFREEGALDPGVPHGFTELEESEEIRGQNWLIEGIRKLMEEV